MEKEKSTLSTMLSSADKNAEQACNHLPREDNHLFESAGQIDDEDDSMTIPIDQLLNTEVKDMYEELFMPRSNTIIQPKQTIFQILGEEKINFYPSLNLSMEIDSETVVQSQTIGTTKLRRQVETKHNPKKKDKELDEEGAQANKNKAKHVIRKLMKYYPHYLADFEENSHLKDLFLKRINDWKGLSRAQQNSHSTLDNLNQIIFIEGNTEYSKITRKLLAAIVRNHSKEDILTSAQIKPRNKITYLNFSKVYRHALRNEITGRRLQDRERSVL